MRKLATGVIVALACLIAAVPTNARPSVGRAQHHHHAGHRYPHHRECFTARCARNADRAYARRHRPKVVMTIFDLCVANQENGEPGATTAYTVNWHARNSYDGAFSWEQSKWEAGGGLRFARHAYEASPIDQVAVFHHNGRNGEWTLQNWPTIARC